MRLGHVATASGPVLFVEHHGERLLVPPSEANAPRSVDELLLAPEWLDRIGALASSHATPAGPAVQLGPPLTPPGAVIAIGLNYHDLCEARGLKPPTTPVVFAKLSSSVIGPGAEITWRRSITDAVSWEAELGVVVGRETRDITESDALAAIFGYTVVNDVTAADIQRDEHQWLRAKSLDTFCPIGPVIVTSDEIPDPQDLRVRSWVNGEPMQDSSTADMIFSVAEVVSYLSRSFTLRPGDVIATGTPVGVGPYRSPPVFLTHGDLVDVEVDVIGRLSNPCRVEPVAAPADSGGWTARR